MARKKALSREMQAELFDYIRHGHHSYKDAARKFGVSQTTASRYYHDVLRRRGKEMIANGGVRLVVVRDEQDKLTFNVDEGYVGHAVVGSISDRHEIDATNDVEAIVRFDEWLATVNADRKALCEMEEETEGVDLERELKEKSKLLIEAVEQSEQKDALIADLQERLERATVDRDELEERLSGAESEIERLRAADEERVSYRLPETVYAVMVEKPAVKGFGYFTDLDVACAKVNEMDEMAAVLGMPGSVNVHELTLRE